MSHQRQLNRTADKTITLINRGLLARPAPALPFARKRPSITLCIPFEEVTFSKWTIPMFRFMLSLENGDNFVYQEGAFIDTARNKLAEAALETKSEYFYMVDTDNPPPDGALERLISHRKDIVGGWYKVKKGNHPAVYMYAGQDAETGFHNYMPIPHAPSDDNPLPGAPACICGKHHANLLQEVDAIGFGCMLIHRSVFEKIAKHEKRWFSTDEGGTEDMYFCRLAQKYGFAINVDWKVHAGHVGVFLV